MNKILITLTAVAALGAAHGALAQTSGEISMSDQEQLLIARIQGDKRAIVLSTLQLTDADVRYDCNHDGEREEAKWNMTFVRP